MLQLVCAFLRQKWLRNILLLLLLNIISFTNFPKHMTYTKGSFGYDLGNFKLSHIICLEFAVGDLVAVILWGDIILGRSRLQRVWPVWFYKVDCGKIMDIHFITFLDFKATNNLTAHWLFLSHSWNNLQFEFPSLYKTWQHIFSFLNIITTMKKILLCTTPAIDNICINIISHLTLCL